MLGESLLILFWIVLVSVFIFFGVGYISYHFRKSTKGTELGNSYTLHVVEFLAFLLLGFIIAIGFTYTYAGFKNHDVKASLNSTTPLALIADQLKRPTAEEYVNYWFDSKIGPAFGADGGGQRYGDDQLEFINAVVVSNKDAEEKIPPEHPMIRTLALSPTLSPACNNLIDSLFTMMLVFIQNNPLPDIKDSHTTCPQFLTDKKSVVANRDNLRQFFESKIIPDSSLSSLLLNELNPPNPTTIRLEMLSSIRAVGSAGGGAKDVVDQFAVLAAKSDDHNPLQAMKIVDAVVDMMLTATEKDRRIIAIIWGPIQLLTLTMFFCGVMILAERQFNLWDVDSKFNQHLKSNISREKLIMDYEEAVLIPVNYILWALPTLGFIGTVTGISAAITDAYKVALFTDSIAQSGAIKWVTSLLGVAFDTTFLALICSLPLMALAFLVRSQEMIRINEK